MATSVSIYLDAATLALASAAFTDASLMTPAPDGWYSDGTKVRHQVSGVFVDNINCPSCAITAFDSSATSVPYVSTPTSLIDACLTLTLTTTYYYELTTGITGVIQVGDSVFSDSLGTTPLPNGCYVCQAATEGQTNAYRVVSGVVTEMLFNCSSYTS